MKFSALVLFISQIVGAFSGLLYVKTKTVKSGGKSSPLLGKLSNQFDAFKSSAGIARILAHPTNRRRVVLMCRNKYYLIMKESGRLMGTKDPKYVKDFGMSYTLYYQWLHGACRCGPNNLYIYI